MGTLPATRVVASMRTCCPPTHSSMVSVVSRCESVLQCKPLFFDGLAGNQQALLHCCKVERGQAVRWTCLSHYMEVLEAYLCKSCASLHLLLHAEAAL